MSALIFVGLWFFLALAVGLLFHVLHHAMSASEKWDELARTPYQHPGWERRDVTVVPRAFDWSRDEVSL